MFTIVTLLILGTLLGGVLMQLFERRQPAATPAADLSNLKVTDARPGDVISISGAGERYADLDFTSDRMVHHQAGPRRWFELSGPYQERRVTLRVGGDDEVEVHLQSDPRKLAIDEIGLAEEDLAEMDERQNTGDSFEFDGKVWMYRLSREAQAVREGENVPAGYYYWEFQEQAGRGLVTVRKAEGEPFTVTLFGGIAASDVTIYRGSRG